MRPLPFALSCASFWAVCGAASGQDLVHTSIDPSFGGSAFNSPHLLGVAGAQNTYKDPASVKPGQSQASLFASQLQSRLLSALANQVTDAIFGENPQESGVITFGGQTITFTRGLESVELTISDATTGEVTRIEVPTFVKAS